MNGNIKYKNIRDSKNFKQRKKDLILVPNETKIHSDILISIDVHMDKLVIPNDHVMSFSLLIFKTIFKINDELWNLNCEVKFAMSR